MGTVGRDAGSWPLVAGRATCAASAAKDLPSGTGSLYCAAHMPEIKRTSKSSAKKRFKLTANGRVKRKKAYLRHNLGAKSTSAKRNLRRGGYVSETQEHQIKAMLPYGS